MNNNNLKFFIAFALTLGVIVVLGEIGYSVFGNKAPTLDSSVTSIQPLPTGFPTEFLSRYTERGDKYMFISAEEFEGGISPEDIRSRDQQGEATPAEGEFTEETTDSF